MKFVIGFAGSGKSTELAKRAKPTTLVLTPTHKAAKVLIAKGVLNVYTIHSVLKLVPTLNESFRKGQKMRSLQKVGDTDLSDISDIFIDEYSMINTKILDMLVEVLPKHATLTVFGDQWQLPPVEGVAVLPNKYSKEIFELKIQYRAKAPNVVEIFMRFMLYLKDGSVKDLTIDTNRGPDLVAGTLEGFNPDTDRALAFTNACVLDMNLEIARNLNLPDEISFGEDITVNGLDAVMAQAYNGMSLYPNCLAKGKILEDGDLIKKIIKTKKDMKTFRTDISHFPTCYITVEDIVYEVSYDLGHHETARALESEVHKFQHYVVEYHSLDEGVDVAQWCKSNKFAKYVKERGKAWSEYLAHQNLVFDLRRPFASTIHKSQGSEFSTVYINQSDIKKSIRHNYFDQYARLMYVGLSRAIDKVVLV